MVRAVGVAPRRPAPRTWTTAAIATIGRCGAGRQDVEAIPVGGATGQLTVGLSPGQYVLLGNINDAVDGPAHYRLGMRPDTASRLTVRAWSRTLSVLRSALPCASPCPIDAVAARGRQLTRP